MHHLASGWGFNYLTVLAADSHCVEAMALFVQRPPHPPLSVHKELSHLSLHVLTLRIAYMTIP